MNLQDIKTKIENQELFDKPVIFHIKKNAFVPQQYIHALIKYSGLAVNYIDNLDAIVALQNDIFGADDDIKYYVTDVFDYTNINICTVNNLFIICNKISKNAEDIFLDYIVDVPDLEDWQIHDYVLSLCEGVPEEDLNNLIKLCNNDIYRIDQELSKIAVFTEEERPVMFKQFVLDGVFNDLSTYNIYDFSNALLKRDKETLTKIYLELDRIDVEPIGLVTILLGNFRKIISIQLAKNPTPESVGMKPNQFYAVRYSCGLYTKEQLLLIYSFLLDIDKKLKNGIVANDRFLTDYIIARIFSV